MFRYTKLLIIAWLMLSPSSHAQSVFNLEADSATYNKETGIAIYQGNVKISREDIVLEGDTVEVQMVDNEMQKLIATAKPSRLVRREDDYVMKAQALRIEYQIDSGIVDLRGKVRISEDDKLLVGDHAIYDINKKIVKMKKSKNRVKLILKPKQKTQ